MKSAASAPAPAARQVGLAGVGAAIQDVVAHGAVQQRGVLRDHADVAAQAVLRDMGDVLPVDQDAARLHVMKALQQAKVMSSKCTSPCVTTSGLASGASTTVRGLVSVLMPSWMVPTLSNRVVISHITQWAWPDTRRVMAVTAATAPAPTSPADHSHSAVPQALRIMATTRMWFTISNRLTRRIWA